MYYFDYFVSIGGEIPDEISLCIAIAGCPRNCKHCHWDTCSNSKELTNDELIRIIKENEGVTCLCYLGGDWNIPKIKEKIDISKRYGLKTALYSGDQISNKCKYINSLDLDYLKIGPYDEKLGGLQNMNTNQRFYRIENEVYDETYLFQTERL